MGLKQSECLTVSCIGLALADKAYLNWDDAVIAVLKGEEFLVIGIWGCRII